MSRNITGTLLNPDGSNAAGAFLLTAKYNTPGTSGVPRQATQTITVTAGAYSDAVELGTYRVTWTPTAGESVNLGVAVIPAGTDIDILTLIAESVFPDGTDVNFGSLTTAALTVTASATFAGATIADLGAITTADINGGTWQGTIDGAWTAAGQTCADLGTVSAATSITTSALSVNGTAQVVGSLQADSQVFDSIQHRMSVDNSALELVGGLSRGAGESASIHIYGKTHASQAGNIFADADAIIFRNVAQSETARITGGNVGIGTSSPVSSLSVTGTIKSGSTAVQGVHLGAEAGSAAINVVASATGSSVIDFNDDATSWLTAPRGRIIYNHTGDYFAFSTDATEKVRIDNSGNVGIGVVPESGWGSAYKALQLSGNSAFWGIASQSTSGSLHMSENLYYDGTNWKGLVTDSFGASAIGLDSGRIFFRVSNGAVTADTNFTPLVALTIENDGGILAPNIKTGTSQVAAGAAAGEIWADTDDANTLKLGV